MTPIIIRSAPYLNHLMHTTKRHIGRNLTLLKNTPLTERRYEVREKLLTKMHVASQRFFPVVTSIDNLIKKKNLSGEFPPSLKPSSNSGRRKLVQGAPGPLVCRGTGDRLHPGRASRVRVGDLAATQNSSVTLSGESLLFS